MSHSENKLKAKHSSAHFCQDPVENIIKKYTYLHCSDQQIDSSSKIHSLYNDFYSNKPPGTLPEGYGYCSTGVSSNKIFDYHLYNFIANYCTEDLSKENDLNVPTKNSKDSTVFSGKNNLCQKECVDKATFCRPVFNIYNRHFIIKTLAQNAKLSRLIQKIITAHKRNKQNEAWNHFINILKSKHSHNNVKNVPCYEERLDMAYDSQFLDDFDSEESIWQSSKQREDLLEAIYENSNEIEDFSDYDKKEDDESNQYDQQQSQFFQRYPFCYPTSSIARLSMLQREKERLARINEKEKIIEDKYRTRHQKRGKHIIRDGNKIIESTLNKFRDMTAQTERTALFDNRNSAIDLRLQYIQEDTILPKNVTNVAQITQTLDSLPENSVKNMSLKEIEKKLELLIQSINNLIDEFKLNKTSKIVSKQEMNNHFNHLRNAVVGSNANQKYFSKSFSNSESILPKDKYSIFFEKCRRENSDLKKINEIFSRELGENASSNKTCAVQITFEVPTKEISTEITKSLSQALKTLKENAKIDEIIIPEPQPTERITIAVNTDPLNILTLLRISTQAMKRFLSYMPNIDYYYYLSRLYLPQLPSVETTFMCNVCGAKFSKASQLSDHIQEHDLGKTKGCCICRNVLGMSRRPVNVYSCRHCGQCFARSYCCELHQETCARRLNRVQDITNSNLLILR